ncbi:hypothetical protein [Phocaeicola sp.]|uniref:hypothetical protein n=1 Tax=Phocaeicola sp. TaxID=2773926 RepID=UPI003AAF5487
MTKDIPEIDDLLKGINDPEMTLTDEHTETTIENQSAVTLSQEESTEERFTPVSDNSDYWQNFLSYLESDTREDKGERMICKLDRDLADSLDECNIHNRSRSDMVNAIVRTFFKTYLPQLAQYRRNNKSLFTNYKETKA